MIAQWTVMTVLDSHLAGKLPLVHKGARPFDSDDSTLKNNINNRYRYRFVLKPASPPSFLCIGLALNKKPPPERPFTPM